MFLSVSHLSYSSLKDNVDLKKSVIFLVNASTQVKRMVVVETEEMYKARKEAEANHKALRPPLVVSHSSPATDSSNMS